MLGGIVREAIVIINSLPPERLAERVVIQQYDITVLEAVYTCVEHFGQHTGQIIFATKLFTRSDLGYYAHLSTSSHNQRTP